jgi:ribonuclease BN (tRNA processing enzyme)
MRLTVVGCSGSVPSPRSPASCYRLAAEGFRLVVDLGSGGLGPLQRYATVSQVDAVALSHLHADHFIDMCSLWVARKYSSEGALPPLPVYGPAEAARRVSREPALPEEPGPPVLRDGPTG